jgi:hypothetical protein
MVFVLDLSGTSKRPRVGGVDMSIVPMISLQQWMATNGFHDILSLAASGQMDLFDDWSRQMKGGGLMASFVVRGV